jgi:hypothetical protein
VIKPHVVWYQQWRTMLPLAVMMCVLGSCYYWKKAVIQGSDNKYIRLSDRYDRLVKEHQMLVLEKVRLQRALEIEQRSEVELKGNLFALHEKSQDFSNQLALYQRILKKENPNVGLALEQFEVEPLIGSGAGAYRLSFLLIQAAKSKGAVRGTLNWSLEGRVAQKRVILNYTELRHDKKGTLNFSINPVGKIEETIFIPEGFIPDQFTINIASQSTGEKTSKTILWPLKASAVG